MSGECTSKELDEPRSSKDALLKELIRGLNGFNESLVPPMEGIKYFDFSSIVSGNLSHLFLPRYLLISAPEKSTKSYLNLIWKIKR